MDKTAVVFQSKYGATKRYAEWIAEELSCDIFDGKNVKVTDLEPYSIIVYGGGLYAGGVIGIDLITKNFDKLCNKKLVVFTCGLADPMDKTNTDSIKKSLNEVFTPQMQDKIKVFYLRGAIDYSKLGLTHKAMMAILHKIVTKKDQESLRSEDKEMIDTYGKAVDFTDKTTIMPITNYVRDICT
ncbi:flavodoxin domain-containing protein [Sedimentibacter sp.]|uniref:flavodoxin domain-containing protein n=1 Tax=Sedimentibacter sp. TaxID=1960295 RepID=UPI0028ADB526|nr:flavodoxin domain-containing protein [Sedimentibacter sp.]